MVRRKKKERDIGGFHMRLRIINQAHQRLIRGFVIADGCVEADAHV